MSSKDIKKGRELAKEDKRKAEEIKPTQKQIESARKIYERIEQENDSS